MKVFERLVIMNKIKFILMVLFIPLLASCVKGLICWDCEADLGYSYVYFDNCDDFNIELVAISLYKDSLSYPYRISLVNGDHGDDFRAGGDKATGPEILRGLEKYYANLNNYSHRGEHFILFTDHDENILLAWDLRDTTQRWADESLWTMDSTFIEVSCGSGIQKNYYNTYTFSEEDFISQQ